MNDRSPSYDDELTRLGAEIRELQQRADQAAEREARVGLPRQPRLARTCREEAGVDDYPSSGDTFWIQFLDSTFTETEGDQTPTHTERQADGAVVAHSLGGYLAEDTVVFAARDNGRWWIWRCLGEGDVLWAKVQSGNTNADANLARGFTVMSCNWEGTGVTGEEFTIYTHIRLNKATALFTNYIVGYVLSPNAIGSMVGVIITDAYDDRFSTLRLVSASGAIPDGWSKPAGYAERFLKVEDSGWGSTGGNLTHQHCGQVFVETQAGTGATVYTSGSSYFIHNPADHTPKFKDVGIIERDS